MFDDIIQSKPKKTEPEAERTAPSRTVTWNQGCLTCKSSSIMLSSCSGKLFCVEKTIHVDPQYFCNKWSPTL